MKTYTTRTVEVIVTDAEGNIVDHQRTVTTNTPEKVAEARDGIDEVFDEVDKVFSHVDSIFTKAAKLFNRFKR